MGPMAQREIRPKLSSSAVLSPRTEAKPIPIAITKGTIIGPVVTPPESKATAKKSSWVKAAKINIREYKTIKICDNLI